MGDKEYIEQLKAIRDVNKYRASGLTPEEVCCMAKDWKRMAKIFGYVDELGGSEVLEKLVAVKREAKVQCAEQILMDAARELYTDRFKREGVSV